MSNQLTEKQQTKLKNAFVLLSEEVLCSEDGNIPTSELGTLVRASGKNPTEAELEAMTKEIEAKSGDAFDLDTFISVMTDRMNDDNDSIEKIGEAFRMLDQEDKGFIPCDKLKRILTSHGDKLTEDEITGFILDADINKDNKITYDEFMSMMNSK